MREKRMIWQEFCYDLIEARGKDTTEDVYQELVESNLRQLGWSKVRGEICPKERINVGSHNQIEPDITIKLSDQPAFVIELKRPRNAITPRQEQQLLSYMRLRKTSFGLYIGDDIKLYYDTNEDLPTEVWRTDLALDAASGEEFVDLFHHDTFSRQRIESLCDAQVHTIKTRQAMADFRQSLETDPDDTIRRVLTDYFVLQKRCDPAIVEEALNRLHFATQTDGTGDKVHATPLAQSAEYSCPAIHQAKHKRDTTKYSLDEGKHFFGKGKFVREVVAKYMEENPGLTYEQLTQIFFPKLQGTSLGVLRTLQSIDSLDQKKKKDLSRRYVLTEGLTLTSADGTTFAVCTQWNAKNFLNILALLNKWGWNIVTNHAQETNP